MKSLLLSTLTIVGVLVAGHSAMAQVGCFSEHEVRSFQPYSSNEVVVRTWRESYHLQVSFCSELPWAHSIAFQGFGGRVCRGDRLLILDNFNNGHVIQSCFIHDITKI